MLDNQEAFTSNLHASECEEGGLCSHKVVAGTYTAQAVL
jgi:hypothetical protein